MNKFRIILLILTVTISFNLVTEEPTFILTEDSPVWNISESFKKKKNIEKTLLKGTKVFGLTASNNSRIGKVNSYISDIIYNKKEYQIETRYLLPVMTDSYFDNKLIYEACDPNREVWVISYYLDIFSSQYRGDFEKYAPDYLKEVREWNAQEEYGSADWWQEVRVNEGLIFSNTSLSIGKRFIWDFLIHNIARIESGYIVTVQGDRRFIKLYNEDHRFVDKPFPTPNERKTFDLIFIQDGDYMDVYLDSMDNFFATYARVQEAFYDELEDLIYYGESNYSRVTQWPKRADGTMDFPPVDPGTLGL